MTIAPTRATSKNTDANSKGTMNLVNNKVPKAAVFVLTFLKHGNDRVFDSAGVCRELGGQSKESDEPKEK